MSNEMYLVRLNWDGRTGVAKQAGGQTFFTAAPWLGIPYVEIDFCPGICSQIRVHSWDSVRDMNSHEIDVCVRYLLGMHELPPT